MLIDTGLPENIERLFDSRSSHSEAKLRSLRSSISKEKEVSDFPDITIYCAGSYARHEASQHSDIDLFFISNRSKEDYGGMYRVPQIRLMSSIVKTGDELGFPKFSNDGQFLQIIHLDDVLNHLGGIHDDYENFFTARLLMILESKSIYGDLVYDDCMNQIISSYFRDYPGHESEFRPNFLINDIVRFWKTLCLNYEHKRNQPTELETKKLKQKIKNFKLKFSRMMTCYASIAYLTSLDSPIREDAVKEMTQLTPANRLRSVVRFMPNTKQAINHAMEKYHWFLERTNVSEDELLDYFSDEGRRTEAFQRSKEFGDSIYQVLKIIDSENDTFRYLVV